MRHIRFRVLGGGRAALYALLGMTLSTFLSCTTPISVEKESEETPAAQQERSRVFRSEHYVVVLPAEEISAEELAEQFLGGRDRAWVIVDANGGSFFHERDVVAIPLREENPGGLTDQGYQTVPVLCYRGFVSGQERAMHIRAETFQRQMGFLQEHGYRVVGLADLLAFLHYQRGLPENAVVITVDGVNRSVYEIAYPILRRFEYPAALFVAVEAIGAYDGALNWDQIREMKASGWEIGVHASTQFDLSSPCDSVIDSENRMIIRSALSKSKQVLDEKLNQDTMALAFPYTRVTPGILHLAQSLGYRLGMTVRPGANPFFADPLALRREQISEEEDLSFQSRLKTFTPEPLP